MNKYLASKKFLMQGMISAFDLFGVTVRNELTPTEQFDEQAYYADAIALQQDAGIAFAMMTKQAKKCQKTNSNH